MLRRLFEREQYLSELAAPLEMSFPAASKHVRVLEDADLVERRVVGRTHICRVAGDRLSDASRWLEGYRRLWETKFQALDELLVEMKDKEQRDGGGP